MDLLLRLLLLYIIPTLYLRIYLFPLFGYYLPLCPFLILTWYYIITLTLHCYYLLFTFIGFLVVILFIDTFIVLTFIVHCYCLIPYVTHYWPHAPFLPVLAHLVYMPFVLIWLCWRCILPRSSATSLIVVYPLPYRYTALPRWLYGFPCTLRLDSVTFPIARCITLLLWLRCVLDLVCRVDFTLFITLLLRCCFLIPSLIAASCCLVFPDCCSFRCGLPYCYHTLCLYLLVVMHCYLYLRVLLHLVNTHGCALRLPLVAALDCTRCCSLDVIYFTLYGYVTVGFVVVRLLVPLLYLLPCCCLLIVCCYLVLYTLCLLFPHLHCICYTLLHCYIYIALLWLPSQLALQYYCYCYLPLLRCLGLLRWLVWPRFVPLWLWFTLPCTLDCCGCLIVLLFC